MKKRKADEKEWMLVTQGTVVPSPGARSPWEKAMSHQTMAKSSQLHRKDMVNMSSVWGHLRSTSVVNTSCRKAALLSNVLVGDVAVAFLGHEVGPPLPSTVPGLCRVLCQPGQHIFLRDNALSGQHGSVGPRKGLPPWEALH